MRDGETELIDFHNHVIPGVDDGAANVEEALAALEAFRAQGVGTVVATPHVSGEATLDQGGARRLAEIDRGWDELVARAASTGVTLARGAEVMLDIPLPDLADPRLRLAGTKFVLVEFPFMTVPPNATQAIFGLRMAGWIPVLAHPERYSNALDTVADAEEWRRVGAHLQVNAASLVGRYGEQPQRLAWRLVRRGMADYLSSDYHARGRLPVTAAAEALAKAGGSAQARLLMEENPARLLAGEPPLAVPPLGHERPSFWKRVISLGRG